MFDQANRSIWLEDMLWHRLRDEFPSLHAIPLEVLITVGYPSSGARGRSSKIKPAEVSYQWHGNPNEKAFISIHPAYFDSVENAMKAVLFGAAKLTGGARWGASKVGLSKTDDGKLIATSETQAKLDALREELGDPPAGFGVPFPCHTVARTRLRKYVCSVKTCTTQDVNGKYEAHPVIRSASDTLKVTCNTCQNPYVPA